MKSLFVFPMVIEKKKKKEASGRKLEEGIAMLAFANFKSGVQGKPLLLARFKLYSICNITGIGYHTTRLFRHW